jgi:hypothetical protein
VLPLGNLRCIPVAQHDLASLPLPFATALIRAPMASRFDWTPTSSTCSQFRINSLCNEACLSEEADHLDIHYSSVPEIGDRHAAAVPHQIGGGCQPISVILRR